MIMKRIILLLLFFIFVTYCFGQDEDFSADRPGLSDAPDIIPPGSWQIEAGIDLSDYNHYGMFQLPTNILRYGINKHLEARLDFGAQYDPKQKIYGVSPFALGLKILITDQRYLFPQTAYIVEVYPPPLATTQGTTGLGMELCLNHDLKNDDNIYYNVGLNWIDIKSQSVLNALLGYNHELNKYLEIFGELYYYSSKDKPNNYVSDTGITWQMNKNFQWDLSFGVDIIKPKGNFYFEFGFAYIFR